MLTGELVTLRTLSESDFDRMYELAAELDTWEQRNPSPPAPLNRAAWEDRIKANLADEKYVQFGVEVAGTLIGQCSLQRVDQFAQHAEIGIGMHAEHRGRGYGTDALRVLCEFAFVRRNLRRVYLHVVSTNESAIASYRRAGFREEGRLREHAYTSGRYVDELIMGLLRSERSTPAS